MRNDLQCNLGLTAQGAPTRKRVEGEAKLPPLSEVRAQLQRSLLGPRQAPFCEGLAAEIATMLVA